LTLQIDLTFHIR